MYNYHILTKFNKTDIMEKLVKMSLETMNYEEYEETADHLLWLFEKCKPEVLKTFFPEKEVKDVQLPEIERSRL